MSAPRTRTTWVAKAYEDYSAGRRTLTGLSQQYKVSVRTLQRYFDTHTPCMQTVSPPQHSVPCVFDATFFGRSYGILVYRAQGRNIHWQEIDSEKITYIEQGLLRVKEKGWVFSSFTIDGRPGVIQRLHLLFPKTPVQMCLFHQKAILQRYTTTRPKTECGKAIRSLMLELQMLTEEQFHRRLQEIKTTYHDFLKERNENNQFMHRKLRSALRSLTRNAPYLFTCKRFPELAIPNTTNSCDGSFAHWKAKVKIHRGLRKDRRIKMINYLLAKS